MRKAIRLFYAAGVLAALATGAQAALASPAATSFRPACWICYELPDGGLACYQVPCP